MTREEAEALLTHHDHLSAVGLQSDYDAARAALIEAMVGPDYEADAIAAMCPNCVSPWKCNGPHIPESRPAPPGE